MSRMTFAEGVSAADLRRDLSTQFLGMCVGRIDSAHIELTEKGRSKASIIGEFMGVTFDKVKTPILTNGILFNPSLLEKLRLFFESNDVPAYVSQNGAVSATAPATVTTDKVVSKEELNKEKEAIQSKYFSLKDAEKAEADARLAAIEVALKA